MMLSGPDPTEPTTSVSVRFSDRQTSGNRSGPDRAKPKLLAGPAGHHQPKLECLTKNVTGTMKILLMPLRPAKTLIVKKWIIRQRMKKLMNNYIEKSAWATNLILLRNLFLLHHRKKQDQVR